MYTKTVGTDKSRAQQFLTEDIGHLLDDMAIRGSQQQVCESCGSPVEHVPFIFFMSGSDRVWNVPLAVCSDCERRASGPASQYAA
jgi:hypothetical protein